MNQHNTSRLAKHWCSLYLLKREKYFLHTKIKKVLANMSFILVDNKCGTFCCLSQTFFCLDMLSNQTIQCKHLQNWGSIDNIIFHCRFEYAMQSCKLNAEEALCGLNGWSDTACNVSYKSCPRTNHIGVLIRTFNIHHRNNSKTYNISDNVDDLSSVHTNNNN